MQYNYEGRHVSVGARSLKRCFTLFGALSFGFGLLLKCK